MKTKFLVFLSVLAVLMLFACTNGGVNESAENGIVKISFAVEPEDTDAKIINVGNPDLLSDLTYQYKAIAGFKLADGSAPVGDTGDVWTDLKKEMSFAVGSWTFDVRAIQNDVIVYETEAPVKAVISVDSAKIITFNVKKKVEGTGNININISVNNPIVINEGDLVVELVEIISGESYRWEEIAGYFNWNTGKFCFNSSLKDIASGFYKINFVYLDYIEKYKYPLNQPVEVFNGKDTNIKGEIDLGSPNAIFFVTDEQAASLECQLNLEKRIFSPSEKIPFAIKGRLYRFENQKELIINKEKIEEVKEVKKENLVQKQAKQQAVPVVDQNAKKAVVDAKQLEQVKKEAVDLVVLKEKEPINLDLINKELKPIVKTKTDITDETAINYFVAVYEVGEKDDKLIKDEIEIKPDGDLRYQLIHHDLKEPVTLESGKQYKLVFTVKAVCDKHNITLKADADPIVITQLK